MTSLSYIHACIHTYIQCHMLTYTCTQGFIQNRPEMDTHTRTRTCTHTCKVLLIEVRQWRRSLGESLQYFHVFPSHSQMNGGVPLAVRIVDRSTSDHQHTYHLQLLGDHCQMQWCLKNRVPHYQHHIRVTACPTDTRIGKQHSVCPRDTRIGQQHSVCPRDTRIGQQRSVCPRDTRIGQCLP